MADSPRKKTLEELRSEATAELERRGYDVRGKTPEHPRKSDKYLGGVPRSLNQMLKQNRKTARQSQKLDR